MDIKELLTYVSSNLFHTKIAHEKYNTPPNFSNIIFNSISVSVLPKNAAWNDLDGFENRKYGPFNFNFQNSHKVTIAGIQLWVSYNCNGKFNSTGHYLADVTISPTSIFAEPGYYLTCNVTTTDPINYGTKLDPIPGIKLKLQMQVKSYNNILSNKEIFNPENKTSSNSIPLTISDSSLASSNRLNAVEKYLIVIIRGDGQISLVTATGY